MLCQDPSSLHALFINNIRMIIHGTCRWGVFLNIWHLFCMMRNQIFFRTFRTFKCQDKTMRRQEAFTLIELLIVLVVLAAMAAIAIPGFSRWLPNYRLKSAANDIFSEMQSAKMEAIKNNSEWAIVFNAGTGTYQVESGGADGDYSTAGDNNVEKTVTLSQYQSGMGYGPGNATTNATQGGGALPGDNISFAGNTVVFNSRGMINSFAGGYVYIQNSANKAYAVGALGSGVIRMKKWDGTAWD